MWVWLCCEGDVCVESNGGKAQCVMTPVACSEPATV